MTSQARSHGLSLYDAARAMGVSFATETVPRDRYVEANGLKFHYLEWGGPSNPPMLLLHGFAQTCHSWDFVALSFSDRYRVIALDQRGHGDSDWASDGDYQPETQQKDIAAVVDRLGLDNFVLMGLSMGGRNSFTYAGNHTDKIKALVIVDAGPQNMRAGSGNIRNFVQQEDELDSVDAFVDRVLKFNPRRDAVQVRGSIMHNLKQLPNGRWTWKYDKLLRSPDRRFGSDPAMEERLWGYLESIRCPTLVVRGGASDIIALETAESMHRRIPNATMTTVEGAGHLVMGDNPSGFQKAVLDFLAGV
ncbi:MAG: alpha/beta hydrolase [Chloroflexi bacterium]|nr:alpha/beta hydrolase [Chloroflexota bacterium]